MPENNIDNIIKNQVEQLGSKDLPYKWNKNSAWERLQRRRKKRSQKWYYSVAAILVISFLLGSLFQYNSYRQDNPTISENAFEEYQKRQKLKEIESRMSGNYFNLDICLACDDFYYESIKQDRPVKFTYFENF